MAKVDLPYDTPKAFTLSGVEEAHVQWWLAFEDPQLNALIDTALQGNMNLQTAWYQLEEAGALVGITKSARWPQISMQLQSGFSVPEPDFVGGGAYPAFAKSRL